MGSVSLADCVVNDAMELLSLLYSEPSGSFDENVGEQSPLLNGTHKIQHDTQEETDLEEGKHEGSAKKKTENDFQTIHVPGTGVAVSNDDVCSEYSSNTC